MGERDPSRVPRPVRRAAALSARVLETLSAKVALSAAIILSLVPFDPAPWVDALDLSFLALFSVEFAMRLLVLVVGDDPDEVPVTHRRRQAGEVALLVIDFVALMTFVPWPWAPDNGRALRLVRLIRIILLAAYWAPIVRDLWTILLREERMRQVALMGFAVAILSFCGAVILDALAVGGIDFNGDGLVDAHDRPFLTRLWWAFRNVQDPGNLLSTPLHLAGVLVSLALTIFGLFLVSFLIGLGTSVVSELVTLGRHRPPGLSRHTVIVRDTPATLPLLVELQRHSRKVFAIPRYVLLGASLREPDWLGEPRFSRVAYRAGEPGEAGVLERTDAARAKRIVILADLESSSPDADVTGLLLQAREANPRARLIAEIVEHSNAPAAQVAGGGRTTLVPLEELMALFVAAAVRSPGLEDLLRILLGGQGHEIYTYLYDRDADDPGALATARPMSFDGLVEAGLERGGDARVMPIGVILPNPQADEGGGEGYQLILNSPPAPDDRVAAREIRGIVAVAESFDVMARFAAYLQQEGLPDAAPTDPPPAACPALEPAPTPLSIRRVLLCGFRPATLNLCEMLMAAEPDGEVLLLVGAEAERRRVLEAIEEHNCHATFPGAWQLGAWGSFRPSADGTSFTYHRGDTGPPLGRLRLGVGDWTRDATLVSLPETGRHVGEHDLVLLLGAPTPHEDGRTAIAALKVAELVRTRSERFTEHFRVVGVVGEDDLARRLEARFRERDTAGRAAVRVLSIRELRAYFTFQAITVPAFASIYSHLLGPWAQSFVKLVPLAGDVPPSGAHDPTLSFADMALSLRAQGSTLVALLLDEPEGPQLRLCPRPGAPGDRFKRSALQAAWVIVDGPTGERERPRA